MVCSKASRAGRLGLAVCVLLFIAQSTYASAMLDLRIERSDGGVWERDLASTDPSNPVINYDYNIDNTDKPDATHQWKFRWSGFGDSDPVVTSNFVVQNTTASTQTYNVTILSAVMPPIAGGTMTGGSVSGSITDGNGNTATVSSVAGGIYTSIIDNVDFVQ